MTFDDDFLVLKFQGGVRRASCKLNNIDWPPPERIDVMGIPMRRVSMSELTDEERAELTFICRGAVYEVIEPKGVNPPCR